MKYKKQESNLKNFIYTIGANVISLLAGIFATFVIPKMLSIEEYAYLRLFTFYLGYVGIFHFGFNDGIYVNYGKYDYEDLPKKRFRTYFLFLISFQILVALWVSVSAIFFQADYSRKIVFLILALNIIFLNLTSYFDYISQVTKRFKLYSFNMILSKILYVLGVLAYVFINNDKGMYFIILQTIINLIVMVIYGVRYKEIIWGKRMNLLEIKLDIKNNFATGFFVMIGNFMSIFIIGVDRIIIDKYFTVEEFAMYSFAVSLLSMFYIIVNAVTVFIYPYLSRNSNNSYGKDYLKMKKMIFIVIGMCLIAYYPFKFIIEIYIPKYLGALRITEIIFPTILLSSEINIVSANFYKILKLQKDYTKNNIIAGSFAVISAVVAYLVFKSSTAIAFSSLLSFFVWSLYSDYFFSKKFNISISRIKLIETITIIIFLILSFKCVWYIGMILYFVCFSTILYMFFKNDIKEICLLIKNKGRND